MEYAHIILGTLGYALLFSVDWKIGIGAFLLSMARIIKERADLLN